MTTFVRQPTTIEAVRWTGKNTGEVKAFIHTQLLADPAAMSRHDTIAPFVKRVGSHMTKTLWGNVLTDCAPEVSAALWVAANGQYVGIVDGEWVAKDRLGFYPIADEDGAPMNYRLPIEPETRQDEGTEENEGKPCLYFACGERQPTGKVSVWWADWGTCSREHAVDHYGEEDVK